jgi:hypothetical protein
VVLFDCHTFLQYMTAPSNATEIDKLLVKIKNQLDATKYAVLLPQHVSGTNIPIIRSTINKYLPLLGGHTFFF